jgi:hypothetical protein
MIPPDSSCRYSCAFAGSFSEPLNRPISRWIFDFPEVARTVKLKSCQPRAILVERNAKHNATLFTPAIGDKLHHHQRIFLQLLANDNATAVCVYDHRLAFDPKIACRTKTRDCNRNLSREPGATPGISLVSLQCRPSASIQRAELRSKFMLNPFLKSSHISWIRLRKRNNRRELRSRGWCLRKSLVGCCYEIRKADRPLSNRSANIANTEFTPQWLPALLFPPWLLVRTPRGLLRQLESLKDGHPLCVGGRSMVGLALPESGLWLRQVQRFGASSRPHPRRKDQDHRGVRMTVMDNPLSLPPLSQHVVL